jgi:hypothetical protein
MATVRDIVMNADAFRAAYPNWPHPEPAPAAVTIGGRLYGLDDAVAASAVLAEHDAGRTQTATGLAVMARLDALDRNGLEALCAAFSVEVYPLATLTD